MGASTDNLVVGQKGRPICNCCMDPPLSPHNSMHFDWEHDCPSLDNDGGDDEDNEDNHADDDSEDYHADDDNEDDHAECKRRLYQERMCEILHKDWKKKDKTKCHLSKSSVWSEDDHADDDIDRIPFTGSI